MATPVPEASNGFAVCIGPTRPSEVPSASAFTATTPELFPIRKRSAMPSGFPWATRPGTPASLRELLRLTWFGSRTNHAMRCDGQAPRKGIHLFPESKAKSVVVTEEGVKRSQEPFEKYFVSSRCAATAPKSTLFGGVCVIPIRDTEILGD